MDAREILTKARELIADPDHWTQRDYARTKNGDGIWPTNPGAVCWCAGGAVIHVSGADGENLVPRCKAIQALDAAATEISQGAQRTLVTVNDRMGHAATLAMFDLAIERTA